MIARFGCSTIVMALSVTVLLATACGQPASAAPPPELLSEAPWAGNLRVNDDTGSAKHQASPSIAVDPGGNAYAVWMDRRSGYDDIYFAYRPAGGSWGTNVRVSDDTGTKGQMHPRIAVDPEGNAYAVWTDYRNAITNLTNSDIYFSYRPAGGSWSANVRVDDDAGTHSQDYPSIAVDPSGNAYALWTDNRNTEPPWFHPDIYFSYRPADGNWGTNVKVDDDATGADQGGGSIAVDASGNAYAVWSDSRNGNPDVYFSYRPAGGSWGTNVRVDDNPGTGGAGSTSIAVDPNANAYAVWVDGRNGNPDIYFAYRPSGGSWGTNARVDDDAGTGKQDSPSIAVDPSGNAYAVWEDERILADPDIYVSYRPAAGAWGASVRLNDDVGTPNEQHEPAIAVDPSGSAFAVWFDARNEWDPDIYFCSNWWAFKVYVPLTIRKHQ